MVTEHKQGYCTLCRSRCGTVNEVRDDMLIAVRPDPSHPTGQAMCMKGRAAPELVHSVHRVHHPMRRTRPKGDPDPGWVRISWEEALRETAERLGAIKAQSGAEAVVFAVTTPSGTPLSDSVDWIERFVRSFGSPNICYGTEICNWHKDVAHAFTFGCGIPVADYEQSELIVLWGHNPANTWLAQASAIAKGRANGAKMIVVDPRPTALARQADVWLPVRPGTDAALALGIIRLMIESGGFDEAFVRAWSNGPFLVREDTGLLLRERDLAPRGGNNGDRCVVWDEAHDRPIGYDPDAAVSAEQAAGFLLRGSVSVDVIAADGTRRAVECSTAFELLARAAALFTPERVHEVCGVGPDALATAAALFTASRRTAYHAWTGIGQHTNATQSERAVASLYALTGSFDRIGGNRVRRGPPVRSVNDLALMAPTQRAKAIGLAERPIGPPAQGWVTARDTYRAILDGEPYKLRAMVAFGTNLPVSQGDTQMARDALQALEFHVHCDLYETPAARYADIFLPVNTPWEREGLRIGFEINDAAAALVQLRPRMVSPRGESRSDNQIVFDLACGLGMGEAFFGGSLEAGWNHMLAPLGVTVEDLRQRPGGMPFPIDARERKYALPDPERPGAVKGFATQTRRVELYSELLHRHAQPPLPQYVPTAESADSRSGDAYPLILSSAKNGYYCHSQHRSLVSLRQRAPDPVVELSPATARRRDIQDGDWVRVATRIGSARFVARLTPSLADDVVVAEFGWWQACAEFDRPPLPEAEPGGSNFNNLISAEAADPISGSVPHRSFRCEVALDRQHDPRQRPWPGHRAFVVAELRAEAEGVLGVHLVAQDGGPLPDHRPGQHVETRVVIDGVAVGRAYSLTCAAALPGRRGYSIAVRHQKGRAPDGTAYEGLVSGHLHRALRVGDVVELRAPSGNFVLPRRSHRPLVLIAGGIGITPFISLLESLADGDASEIHLFYANQNSRTHAFRERLRVHGARLPGLRVFNAYNLPLPEDQLGITHDTIERIAGAVVHDALLERRPLVYLCGPPPMMDAVRHDLLQRGLPRFDIFSEVFRSPPQLLPGDDHRAFKVSFARSQRPQMSWSSKNGTLLAFGESLGLQLASGCRVGQCESCAARLLSGKVRHLHGVEPDDPAVCLTCQAVPTEDIVLDA